LRSSGLDECHDPSELRALASFFDGGTLRVEPQRRKHPGIAAGRNVLKRREDSNDLNGLNYCLI
jgi:hypothetical protein